MRYRCFSTLLFFLALTACIPPQENETSPSMEVALSGATYQKISDLQTRRAEEEMLAYLSADSAAHRYLAARAFGSFPSLAGETIDSLAQRLGDPVEEVRTQAAYALGQTGDSLVTPLLTAAFDRSGMAIGFNAMLLQAVGKTGVQKDADRLATISNYTSRDTLLVTARAWGIYYAALRGFRSSLSDSVMVGIVIGDSLPLLARHPAAHYLHRIDFIPGLDQVKELQKILRSADDAIISSGIISALGRSGISSARLSLLSRSERTEDWRDRVEIIRALAGFEYASVRESILDLLRNPHPLVSITAADFMIEHGTEADAPLYVDLAEDPTLSASVSIRMYRAANRHLSPYLDDYRDRIVANLKTTYLGTNDGFIKAQAVTALAEFPWTYRLLAAYYSGANLPIVSTSIAAALQSISERKDFDEYFRTTAPRIRRELATAFQAYILGGEEGPAYHAAAALASTPDIYRELYPSLEWIDEALAAFRLPQQLETYTEVFRAANALRGTDLSLPVVADPKSRQIDWQLLLANNDNTVSLQVPAGVIMIRLYPTVAPATVSSFLNLVGEGYYDGKVFHRVVPNFVAQGGGPRGDGYGSEDFTVPTETPFLHYDRPGLIGMASAGKDTEGVQFFFTHRAVPHLEGKYTIFGEIVTGQDMVDRMIPGTPIIRMTIE